MRYNFRHPPALGLRQGPRFDYTDSITELAQTFPVIYIELGYSAHRLFVKGMTLVPVDSYHHRLVHFLAYDSANSMLSASLCQNYTSIRARCPTIVWMRAIVFLTLRSSLVLTNCLVACLKRKFISSLYELSNSFVSSSSVRALIS